MIIRIKLAINDANGKPQILDVPLPRGFMKRNTDDRLAFIIRKSNPHGFRSWEITEGKRT